MLEEFLHFEGPFSKASIVDGRNAILDVRE
jgi:hypothetical protein